MSDEEPLRHCDLLTLLATCPTILFVLHSFNSICRVFVIACGKSEGSAGNVGSVAYMILLELYGTQKGWLEM